MTSADWVALGISRHGQLRMSLAERVQAAGVDAVVARVAMSSFADNGWSMPPYVREQILGYLAETEWDGVTAPVSTSERTPARP